MIEVEKEKLSALCDSMILVTRLVKSMSGNIWNTKKRCDVMTAIIERLEDRVSALEKEVSK